MSSPEPLGDLYSVLEIDREADHDTIARAVLQQRRRWVHRQNSANVTSQRKAEDQLMKIDAAELELLDPSRRRIYDDQLVKVSQPSATPAAEPTQTYAPPVGPTAVPPPPAPRTDWLGRAESELSRGDLRAARYAAAQATELAPQSHEAWFVRSQVSRASNRLDDAIFEINEALRFHAAADYFAQLGEVNQAAGYWRHAITAYRNAAELDPGEPAYNLVVADIWTAQSRVDLALPILESLHADHPDRVDINRSLAYSIAANIPSYMTLLNDNSFLFTSIAQITAARADLQRALSLPFADDSLRSHLDKHLRETEEATRSVWSFPPAASPGRVFARWIGWIVLAWVALAWPINLIKQPQAVGTILGLLAISAVVVGFVKLYRKPAWRRNAQRSRRFVHRWGV